LVNDAYDLIFACLIAYGFYKLFEKIIGWLDANPKVKRNAIKTYFFLTALSLVVALIIFISDMR